MKEAGVGRKVLWEERAKENIYVGIALDLTVEKGSWRATAEWLGVQANGRCYSWVNSGCVSKVGQTKVP